MMKTLSEITETAFLVGGAIRNRFLGKEAKDFDYVVVGSTQEEMLSAGFTQVGNSFPVFLHPETGDEYALARTERKVSDGHTGFEFSTEDVTLEEDLKRRDFTFNSIALDQNGEFIDPFNGIEDLQNHIIRATSEAFMEDPLRVYRLARFHALLNFSIDPDTMVMAMRMARTEEFKNLSPERVLGELEKSFSTNSPSSFFRVLKDIGGLGVHFPEVEALIGQTQPEKWHPEGDAFEHTMQVLDQSAITTADHRLHWSALVHDLGKGLTPKDQLPHHYGHESGGVKPARDLAERLRVPSSWKSLADLVVPFHMHVHKVRELNPKTFVKLFERAGEKNNLKNILDFPIVSIFDVRGRGVDSWKVKYDNHLVFSSIMSEISKVSITDEVDPEKLKLMKVGAIKDKIRRMRIARAKEIIGDLKIDDTFVTKEGVDAFVNVLK